MRLYNIGHGSNHFQTLRKYCLQLDHQIDALKRFIDNFNANYIILNLPDTKGRTYYNPEQLISLGILKTDLEHPEIYTSIDPTKMITHQVIDNVYQKNLYIYGNHAKIIPQGFAVRHDGYKTDQTTKYSIIPLANSGSYYTLKDFVINTINNDEVTTEIT